jgi:hypothetical protein
MTNASTSRPTMTAIVRCVHSIHAAVSDSGGISVPWQVGQSGQPMPEPVLRTMAPTTTNKKVVTAALSAKR